MQTLGKKIDGIADIVGTLSNTVDSLARSTKEGFDRMDTFHTEMTDFKEDMTDFAKKTSITLFNLDSRARMTNERLDTIEKSLPPLVVLSEALKREVLQLNTRVGRLETKVGMKTS